MSKRVRFIFILAVLAVCFAFLWPSIGWYYFTPKELQALALSSLEKIKDYSRIMADEDITVLKNSARSDAAAPVPAAYAYLNKEAKKNYKINKQQIPSEWTLSTLLSGFTEQDLHDAIESRYRKNILSAKDLYSRSVKLGLDLSGGMSIIVRADLDAAFAAQGDSVASDNEALFKQDAMQQAIEMLSSRIDSFGLTEPVIRQQGEDRIYIEVPGAAESDRINSIILGRGILNFRLVDDAATQAFNTYYAQNASRTFDANGNLLDPSVIPQDCEVLGLYNKDQYGLDERIGYLVVKKEVILDGKHIKSAEVSSGRTGEPQVAFGLDADGSVIFGDFTTANVGKFLAIVSDTKVKSYARINEPITIGNVAISGFSFEEAQNLKKVLQTAWLSVPLSIESQQVIGASMGEIAINQGVMALVTGLCLVMIFMLLWYKGAGINAVVAQVLNLYMMFSVLSAFGLTLTLPSIAGMILTIGMAVDANVVIFERIRDELRLGKHRAAAVSAGFSRAFWAIMDSNITTFIAALFLSQLGTGPIQGFAVSLAIGVFSSVFTALFVSRLIFDVGTQAFHKKKISIGWGIAQ